jgi:hypothetical protein
VTVAGSNNSYYRCQEPQESARGQAKPKIAMPRQIQRQQRRRRPRHDAQPYPAMSYHTPPCPDTPCHALPYHAMPYPALPFRTLLCPVVPCHTLQEKKAPAPKIHIPPVEGIRKALAEHKLSIKGSKKTLRAAHESWYVIFPCHPRSEYMFVQVE